MASGSIAPSCSPSRERSCSNGKWIHRPLLFTEPGAILQQVLPAFTNEADTAVRERVVRALAGSRLYPEAAILALRWRLKSDKNIQDIILYARWCDNLSRGLAEVYRRHALGESYRTHVFIPFVVDADVGRSTKLDRLLASEAKRLWQDRHTASEATQFRGDHAAIERAFTFGAVMRAVDPGTFSYGHSILVYDQAVEQYGRKKTLKCTVLDSMVCNGSLDWLFGVTGVGVGGWAAAPDGFVQIRGDWGLYVWQVLTEPDIYRRHVREKLERLNAEDAERAKTNACGFFPGLALRLYVRGNEGLLQRLKEQGLRGQNLRTAFLKERERLLNASQFLAHEGRHVLDLNDQPRTYSGVELEFRAKCSEVVFAPDPAIVLGAGSIFCCNIGQPGNGHGMANARIMKGLVAWMEAHQREIDGLDSACPLLPQFDRLTDAQIRVAFRSMDPWASGP